MIDFLSILLTVLGNLVEETAKYALPRRFEAQTLEEALMLGNTITIFQILYKLLKSICYI